MIEQHLTVYCPDCDSMICEFYSATPTMASLQTVIVAFAALMHSVTNPLKHPNLQTQLQVKVENVSENTKILIATGRLPKQ